MRFLVCVVWTINAVAVSNINNDMHTNGKAWMNLKISANVIKKDTSA